MITGQQVYDQMLTWKGTPWQHTQRCKHAGADCIGVLVGVAIELGLNVDDMRNYDMQDNLGLLKQTMSQHGEEVNKDELLVGDVLVFAGRRMYNHVGVYGGEGKFVHSYRPLNDVVVFHLDDNWMKRLNSAYRLKGVVS